MNQRLLLVMTKALFYGIQHVTHHMNKCPADGLSWPWHWPYNGCPL